MKTNKFQLLSAFVLLALILAQLAYPPSAYAAGIAIDTLVDEDAENGVCSLREAIVAANTDTAYKGCPAGIGADSLTFSVGGTITLISDLPAVASDVTIDGGGTITIDGVSSFRAFMVNPAVNFSLSNLTIMDNKVIDGNGGAVYIDSSATVNITNVTLSNNAASDTASPYDTGHGGALYINSGATVEINGSTLSGNRTTNGYGGGISVNGASLSIVDSTFSGNGATTALIGDYGLGGGAIHNNDGTVTISGSTFNGNFVNSFTADGGAIYNGDFDAGPGVPDGNPDTLIVTNSTFANNLLVNDSGGSSGGAIRSNSIITLMHNTFSGNENGISSADGDLSGAVTIESGSATLIGNIFANSVANPNWPDDHYDCVIRPSATINGDSADNLVESNPAVNGCGTPVTTDNPILRCVAGQWRSYLDDGPWDR